MAKYPAMPLYTDAIMADCAHLTDSEFGLYTRMLITMWRSTDCRFPNDKTWVSRRFLRTIELYEKDIMPLLSEFFTCDGNWWTQKRLQQQYEYVAKRSAKQSDNAKSMWNKKKDACHGNAYSGNAPKPKPKSNNPIVPVGFDAFWTVYPRRVNRKKAMVAYAKCTASPETIFQGAKRYAVSVKGSEIQFISHPTTWLNGARWEDESPAAKPDKPGWVKALHGDSP